MTNIKKIQRIPHATIRKLTGAIDANTYAKRLKWQWAGHVARMADERWTKQITKWPGPKGYRKPV